MIRDNIKKDWWKYTENLTEGSMRWRSWFSMWRVAAKYVALRELLQYHVGFEAITDQDETHIRYSSFETLLVDQTQKSDESSNNLPGTSRFTIPEYKGRGMFPSNIIQVSKHILIYYFI
jgi:hypothetical protein